MKELALLFAVLFVALVAGIPLSVAFPGLGLAWLCLGWKAVRKLTYQAKYARYVRTDAWGQKRMTPAMLKNHDRIVALDDRKKESLFFHAVLLLTWPLHEMTFGFSYFLSTMTASLLSNPFVRSIESALSASGVNVAYGLDDDARHTTKDGSRTTNSCLVCPKGLNGRVAHIWISSGPGAAQRYQNRAAAVMICLLARGYSVNELGPGWLEVRNTTPSEVII